MALNVSSSLRQWHTHFVHTQPPTSHHVPLLPLQIVKSSVNDTGKEILLSLCFKNPVRVSQELLALTVLFVTFDNSFCCWNEWLYQMKDNESVQVGWIVHLETFFASYWALTTLIFLGESGWNGMKLTLKWYAEFRNFEWAVFILRGALESGCSVSFHPCATIRCHKWYHLYSAIGNYSVESGKSIWP